jgi:hypothetical protein
MASCKCENELGMAVLAHTLMLRKIAPSWEKGRKKVNWM